MRRRYAARATPVWRWDEQRTNATARRWSIAANVGITAGAFVGGLALPSHGVHSTVALVLALGERRLAHPARTGAAPPEPPPPPHRLCCPALRWPATSLILLPRRRLAI
ncbi:hypothetical protein [Verrucosispora sp. WMMD573]|uniref:hypothetical protein n=1 Tax=Verrucosispora sp. WMMD573 TaxID=3015149 RepID=UPI00248B5829|nr:hypothetical protein [Verrucosispora sp. WMMD573]WBB52654.1 hypothetical protein O7601_18930 [Verrucosispora sp. WMMD573]